ncbi:MAG: hypothetical protein IJ956_03305 [Akkermansia sp.]|nr:hypothetical protein [Akkermansia sp.]
MGTVTIHNEIVKKTDNINAPGVERSGVHSTLSILIVKPFLPLCAAAEWVKFLFGSWDFSAKF